MWGSEEKNTVDKIQQIHDGEENGPVPYNQVHFLIKHVDHQYALNCVSEKLIIYIHVRTTQGYFL